MNVKNHVKHIETDVLYQKMGSKWYVFAEVDGEEYFTELPEGINPLKQNFDYKLLNIDRSVEKTVKNDRSMITEKQI